MTRRICVIGPATNVHIHRWAQALDARGWRVSLISTAPLTHPLPSALRHLPCHVIPTATSGMSPSQRVLSLLHGWARVPGIVAALQPDIVHVHSLPTPAAVPFLRLVRRLVVSAWGSDVVQRDSRKTRLYPHLLAHADQVTATSQYLANIAASYLRTPRPIHVVPFGVDPRRFSPALSPARELRIGTLRHLEANYGLDVLITALPDVLATFPSLHIHIGGAGSLRDSLVEQAQQLGVAERVVWHGRVPHDAVPHFLQTLRLFVNPSRAESFGVAALEAQACGVPVVASNVGGLPEVIRDGVTGLLVPPEQPAALAAALVSLLSDPDRCAAMGRAACEWVIEQYQWDASVARMLDVYQHIIDQQHH